MKYQDFKNKFKNTPFFRSANLAQLPGSLQMLRNQLHKWKTQELVFQLKKGLYTLNSNDRHTKLDALVLSNTLVSPSYISLEYALSLYGLIPEKIKTITAVSTKKTQQYSNVIGHFTYQHLKQSAFTGYIQKQTDSYFYFMATKEKALLDFFYLNINQITDFEAYRFQNLETIDLKILKNYLAVYNNKKLDTTILNFIKYIKQQEYQSL
ncbi:hypothetical protein HOC37_04080 [bacterium]|jgi:predicted transcriptional regulator of viral defense system|nr:hypothetical protein [bacterium]MBT3582169.1 hypothetical protein [bacterium]MBT4552147.1 hypothetical protein [bacterium]MBT5988999.1 hypothetical protein [bacterium]MBT7087574.1 hypothetical protein [bacterium]